MFVISLIIIKVANCERTLCIPQAHCLEGYIVRYFSAHGHHKFIFNFFVIRIFQKNVKAYDCILSGRNLDTYDFDNLLPSPQPFRFMSLLTHQSKSQYLKRRIGIQFTPKIFQAFFAK